MRRALLFILGACSGTPAPRPTPVVVPPAPADAAVDALPPDATPPRVARGGACHADASACADGLTCEPLPQGYCLSTCEHCDDGACVDTWRDGAQCLARCTSDRDCRASEGYLCDPSWHACMLPNAAAIAPKACPKAAHDAAFAPPEQLSVEHGTAPSAAIADDGTLAVLYAVGPTIHGAITTTGFAPRLARTPAGLAAIWIGTLGIELSTQAHGTWSEPIAVADPIDREMLDEPNLAGPYAMYGANSALRIRPLPAGNAVTPMAGARGDLAVGADHRLHVVTINGGALGGYGSSDQRIEYTVSRDGRTFTKPIALSARDEELPWFFAAPAIAVDDKRNRVHIAYVRGGHDARWDLVIVTLADKVQKRAVITTGCDLHLDPALALDPVTGTLHVAFYDSSGITHATCTPGACKIAGSIAQFPISTARSGPRFLGDRIGLVLDDKRRKLHAVWAQPGGIFRASAKL